MVAPEIHRWSFIRKLFQTAETEITFLLAIGLDWVFLKTVLDEITFIFGINQPVIVD